MKHMDGCIGLIRQSVGTRLVEGGNWRLAFIRRPYKQTLIEAMNMYIQAEN